MTQYKKYLEDNYTKATVEAYLKGITIFNNFLDDREVTRTVINEFKIYLLEERKVSIRTVSTYFVILRNYFKFRNIDVKVPVIKYKIMDTYYNKELSKKEINRILRAAKEKNERDYLLILLLVTTGMRVSEGISLTSEQLKKRWIEITCKGKTRTLIIPPTVKTKLKAYVNDNNIKGPIFVSKLTKKAISRGRVANFVKEYGRKAKVRREKCFPHNFRHSYTISEIEIGTDLKTLADDLGHNRIETLEIYKQRSIEEKKKRMNKIARKYI